MDVSWLLCSIRHKQSLSLKCEKKIRNTKLALYYKKYKNKCIHTARLAKNNFYEKKFKGVSGNSKLTWHIVNNITCFNIKNKDDIKFIFYNDQNLDVRTDLKGCIIYFIIFLSI